ncbi:hypothetical protein [Streptomyces sp. NPDC006510]|uniref:hypothetical protein n=1 Tax=Streptomyces sp. NPDC006510 TaxID=3155600 RepID=UPI0033BD5596
MVERFLDELEADRVGRGHQVNIFRVLKTILRDAYDKGAIADDPVKGVQEPEYVREKVVIPTLAYVKRAQGRITAAMLLVAVSPRMVWRQTYAALSDSWCDGGDLASREPAYEVPGDAPLGGVSSAVGAGEVVVVLLVGGAITGRPAAGEREGSRARC